MYWWIFVGTRGGKMRVEIINSLVKSPANMNQLAERLGVNYRTIAHHLQLLEENGIVKAEGPRYGKTYFLEKSFVDNLGKFSSVVIRARGVKP
ncbi:MAG: winged helix-turn-helix transcriptional regulator [Nitrososphaerota archaeon]|jgi:DNA-binding transcriptional ArsR family regulator|nr:winged helix-turn-helix transcriptional regulator [Nitrososphaerota archaeon]MDG6935710.1 winged helix-turn-helix transcriptional regulator [Nitrososphaerota archaeon]MDG6943552.1 winged helix-turn-helix transcriptional regulator [Nitrososphaerota archaeon]